MNAVIFDLQDGFDDDEVIIKIDGRQVFHKNRVKTDLRLGLADTFTAPTAGGTSTVEVAVPARSLSETFPLDSADSPHVGIAVCNNRLEVRPSRVAFGYA